MRRRNVFKNNIPEVNIGCYLNSVLDIRRIVQLWWLPRELKLVKARVLYFYFVWRSGEFRICAPYMNLFARESIIFL